MQTNKMTAAKFEQLFLISGYEDEYGNPTVLFDGIEYWMEFGEIYATR